MPERGARIDRTRPNGAVHSDPAAEPLSWQRVGVQPEQRPTPSVGSPLILPLAGQPSAVPPNVSALDEGEQSWIWQQNSIRTCATALAAVRSSATTQLTGYGWSPTMAASARA